MTVFAREDGQAFSCWLYCATCEKTERVDREYGSLESAMNEIGMCGYMHNREHSRNEVVRWRLVTR